MPTTHAHAHAHAALRWETEQLQGVFAGQALYDAETNTMVAKASHQATNGRAAEDEHSNPHPRAGVLATTKRTPQQRSARATAPAAAAPSGGGGPLLARDDASDSTMGALQKAAAAHRAKLQARRAHSPRQGRGGSDLGRGTDDGTSSQRSSRTAPVPVVACDESIDTAVELAEDLAEQTPVERMRALKELLADGLITQEEFNWKRAIVLDEL